MRINANTFIYHMVMAQALLYIGSFISAPNGLHYHITLDDCIDLVMSLKCHFKLRVKNVLYCRLLIMRIK